MGGFLHVGIPRMLKTDEERRSTDMKRTKALIMVEIGVFAGTLLLQVSWGVAASFESYPVPAATAYVVPDVGSVPPTPTITDADDTSDGAGVNVLVASAHATAWKHNGSARALGFDYTGAGGDGWVFVQLSALSDLPDDLIQEGGKVVVKVTGAAQSTLADPRYTYLRNVLGRWQFEIGLPGQTQVWSDGTGSNFGRASITGKMLLQVGGSAFSSTDSFGNVGSGEGNWMLNCFEVTAPGCVERQDGPMGSGLASLTKSTTIRMPIGQKFLVWWWAQSNNDAIAVIDPLLMVHPDHAQYVALEIDGIEPPTPAPGPLDGVDIDALAARGYNIELLRTLGLLEPPTSNGNISVSPTSSDFGLINVGSSSATRTFRVSNTGTADLVINAVSLSGMSDFSIKGDACSGITVVPSGNCAVQVAFSPASQGSKNETLSIPSNDPDTPSLAIALTGEGKSIPEFDDCQEDYWAEDFVNTLYYSGITTGCSANPPLFCPDTAITRGQMAVFTETSLGQLIPPPCTGTVFSDVNDLSVGPEFCGFIEDFAVRGITGGCQADNPATPDVNEAKYCPEDPITRAQMAVFIEAALGNPANACTGRFGDIPHGHPFCGFVEKLDDDGITGGCGPGLFCPDNPVTRAQMAVFLVAAPAPLNP